MVSVINHVDVPIPPLFSNPIFEPLNQAADCAELRTLEDYFAEVNLKEDQANFTTYNCLRD